MPHPRGQQPGVTDEAVAGAAAGGGERSASLEAVWSSREYRERMRAAYEAAVRDAERRWGRQARICAGELVRDGVAVLRLDTEQVRGRVVRFWRGDSVLDLERVGSYGERGGTSRIRLSRGQQADPELIAFYLVQQAAQLD
jgi:hypothetical protein